MTTPRTTCKACTLPLAGGAADGFCPTCLDHREIAERIFFHRLRIGDSVKDGDPAGAARHRKALATLEASVSKKTQS